MTNTRKWDHYINGEFIPPASSDYLDEFDPRTGKKSFEIAKGSPADVDRAVQAAWGAWGAWGDMRPVHRGRILNKIAQAIRNSKEHLAAIEQAETGRPNWHGLLEVETAAQYFEFYSGLVNVFRGDVIDLGAAYHSYTRREPYGVVGIILPWNAPLNQAARGVAPALAAGNTIVAKPSEYTSASLLELSRIAVEDCGLPAGVLNVVTGTGPEVGSALVSHEGIRKIAFTGSVRTGREIGKVAAERIIPVGLELGGKSPNIVFADCDIDKTVAGTITGFTFNAGQACSAGSRCLVEATIYDAFVSALNKSLDGLKVGSEDESAVGPIITNDQYRQVQSYCSLAADEGADIYSGGELSEGASKAGWYVRPTVLTKVAPDSRLVKEEIFGPVLVVVPFQDEREAVKLANDSDYGLVAAIWTKDLSRAHRVSALLEAGQIFVNEYFAGGVETPFGGYKKSGIGREKGIEALNHYTQLKCVTIRLT